MKKIIVLFLIVLSAFSAFAGIRTFNETWDATLGPAKTQKLKWFQAETVQLNLTPRLGRATVDLSDTNTVVTWEITGWNDTTNVYAATVGLITDIDAGLCEFELPPAESNLPVGTYRGYVRAFTQDGETVEDIGVLCYQNIKVYFAPDGRLFNWEGPYTYAPFDSALTNSIYAGIATNEQDILDNFSDIATLQSDLASTSNTLAATDAALTSGLGSLNADLTTASNTLSAADTAISNALQSQITANDSDIESLQSQVSGNDGEIATLQSDLASTSNALTAADAANLSSLATASNTLTAADASLVADLGSLNADLITVSNTLTTADTTVSNALQNHITSSDVEFANLQAQVSGNDGDISTLQSDLATASNSLSAGYASADAGLQGAMLTKSDAAGVIRIAQGAAAEPYGHSFDALISALAAAMSGDVVLVPPGTFSATSVPGGVSVIGSGVNSTTIVSAGGISIGSAAQLSHVRIEETTGSAGAAMSQSGSGSVVTDVVVDANQAAHGAIIFGFSNVCDQVSILHAGVHGFAVKGSGHRLINCIAHEGSQDGIIIKADDSQSNNNTTFDIEVTGCRLEDCGTAIYLEAYDAASKVFDVNVRDSLAKGCTRAVVSNTDHADSVISNVVIEISAINTDIDLYSFHNGLVSNQRIEVLSASAGNNLVSDGSLILGLAGQEAFEMFSVDVKRVNPQTEFQRAALVGNSLYLSGINTLATDHTGYFADTGQQLIIVDSGVSAADNDPFTGALTGDTWIRLENQFIGTPTLPALPITVTFGFPVAGIDHTSAYTRFRMRASSFHPPSDADTWDFYSSASSTATSHTIGVIESFSNSSRAQLTTVPVGDWKVWMVMWFATSSSADYFGYAGNRTTVKVEFWNPRDGLIRRMSGSPLNENYVR